MSNLTPDRRFELRIAALGRASLTVLANDLVALLDAADDRDRLEDQLYVQGDALADATVDLNHAEAEVDRLRAAVERVRVLANGPYPHARNITGDDLHRALDGTDE